VLLRQVAGLVPDGVRVTSHRFIDRYTSAASLLKPLASLLELDTTDDVDLFVERLMEGERRVVLLDDCENLFLRAIHGFDALDAFLAIVSRTSRNVAWVLTFNLHAWEFLNRVYDRRHHFQAIVEVGGWSDREIQQLIEARNLKSGIRPDFRNLLVRTSGHQNGRFEIVKTARGFYRLLTEFSQGNPWVSMHYWLHSLKPRGRRQVEVALFEKPDETALRELDERQLFALTAIAQHDNLNAEELGRVVEVEPGLCQLDLSYLMEQGFIVLDETGRSHLSVKYLRQVLQRLHNNNLLYAGD